MKWGILAAMDREIELLSEIARVKEKKEHMGTVYYTSEIEGQEVVFACCGVGKVNASICAGALVRDFGAECIVNIGIAGAVGQGLGVLDVVLSKDAVYHDIEAGVLTEYFPNCDRFKADEMLLELAGKACGNVLEKGRNVKVGTVATGDMFIGDKKLGSDIRERTGAECVEMEGAAVAHTAYVFGRPFVIIRSMSDSADDSPGMDYCHFKPIAADQSTRIVHEMLRLYGAK